VCAAASQLHHDVLLKATDLQVTHHTPGQASTA
jgi:hypothetical protein